MKNIFLLAFFCLGVYATMLAKDLIVTPEQVDEKVKKVEMNVQVQIFDLQITGLKNEYYILKDLKRKKVADEDDIQRFFEVKGLIDSCQSKRDSIQSILNKLK